VGFWVTKVCCRVTKDSGINPKGKMMKYPLMLFIASLFTVTSLSPLHAKVISTPGKAIIAVEGTNAAKRVCYYQDQAYSLGSILQVGEHYMVCKEANDFETNGALRWVPLASSSKEQ
jgi:hypothetical protein